MNEPKFPANAETINALVDAVNAMALAAALTMSPQQRTLFALSLSRLASNAEATGNTTLETILIDMHRMVRQD